MNILAKLCNLFRFQSDKNTLGASLTASKNTFGSPGGAILEGIYFVRRK